MKKTGLLTLLFTLLMGADYDFKLDVENIESFYGQWKIVKVKSIRGSILVTKAEVEETLNKIVTISEKVYKRPWRTYEDVIYTFSQEKVNKDEEQVGVNKGTILWFGYESQRDNIYTYYVNSGKTGTFFEVIEDDVIATLYGGHVLTMERIWLSPLLPISKTSSKNIEWYEKQEKY